MTWRKPTCLSHLIRDRLLLTLTCVCGHSAELDPLKLRTAMTLRGKWEALPDLPKALRCSSCGGKSFSIGTKPDDRASAPDHIHPE